MPLSLGIAIIAGPGSQVGATWAENRARSVQNALTEGSGQSNLAGQRGLAVKAMRIIATRPRLKSR